MPYLDLDEAVPCKGCGDVLPRSALEVGYCPACEDDYLCSVCKRECDPEYGLCPDCLDIQREIDRDEAGIE